MSDTDSSSVASRSPPRGSSSGISESGSPRSSSSSYTGPRTPASSDRSDTPMPNAAPVEEPAGAPEAEEDPIIPHLEELANQMEIRNGQYNLIWEHVRLMTNQFHAMQRRERKMKKKIKKLRKRISALETLEVARLQEEILGNN